MILYYISMPDLKYPQSLEMGLGSIGRSPVEAWRRHISTTSKDVSDVWDQLEVSRRIQAWFDKGYRVKEIEVSEK